MAIQDILDVNTLELARQMAIAYSNLFRQTSVSYSLFIQLQPETANMLCPLQAEELMDTSEEVDCTTKLICLSNTVRKLLIIIKYNDNLL